MPWTLNENDEAGALPNPLLLHGSSMIGSELTLQELSLIRRDGMVRCKEYCSTCHGLCLNSSRSIDPDYASC